MEFINKLKELFSSVEPEKTETKVEASAENKEEVKTEMEPVDAKLVDGTIVRCEGSFEVGKKLQVMVEDGSLIDAPQGDHQLEDGTLIVVGEGGMITEIKPAVVDEEMEETKVEDGAVKTEFNAEEKYIELTAKFAEIESALKIIVDGIGAKQEKFSKVEKENAELKAKLEVKPAVKTSNFKKTDKEVENKNEKTHNSIMMNRILKLKEKNIK